jgi:DNA invertase Pin-like site-specific DNA recombinase
MRTALRQVQGVINELDRNMIRKRLRDGRRVKRERGGYVGGRPPYGYRAEGGELVEDEGEQQVIRRIRDLADSGFSTRAIADVLNAEGETLKSGGRWSHVGLWAVLNPDAARKPRGIRKRPAKSR